MSIKKIDVALLERTNFLALGEAELVLEAMVAPLTECGADGASGCVFGATGGEFIRTLLNAGAIFQGQLS